MININLVNNQLSVEVKNEIFNTKFDKEVYNYLIDLQEKLDLANTPKEYNGILETAKEYMKPLTEPNKDFIETFCEDLVLQKGRYYLKALDDNNKTIYSKFYVPQILVNKLAVVIESGLTTKPFIKAFTRYLAMPFVTQDKVNNFSKYVCAIIVNPELYDKYLQEGYSEKLANQAATVSEVSITMSGLIVCRKYGEMSNKIYAYDKEGNVTLIDRYKKSLNPETGEETTIYPKFAEDLIYNPPMMGVRGDAFYCGDTLGHTMKVGNAIKLPSWSMVNCDDYISCVPGLHVGGYSYVQGYKSSNNQLLECLVAPEHIGAICDISLREDGTAKYDGAIRCKEYYIYSVNSKPSQNIYNSSKYLDILEEDWKEYKQNAIKNSWREE